VRLSRYSIIGIMVALLLSAVAIMPVFGAATGTVTLDKTFIAPDTDGTNTVKVTITDADLNVAVAYATDTSFTTSGTGAAGVAQTFTLSGVSGTDKLIDSSLRLDDTDSANYFVSAGFQAVGTAFVQLIPKVNESGAVQVDVGFQEAVIETNTTLVKISSPLSAGFTITVTETAADSGIFEGTFVASATSTFESDVVKRIHALPGMDVTATYSDGDPAGKRVKTVRVEDTKPTAALIGPAHNSTSTTLTPTLELNFTDTDSGLTAGDIQTTSWITNASSSADGGVVFTILTETLTLDTITTAAITNGFKASRKITAGVPDNQVTRIEWQASATDKAGNVGLSDSDTSTSSTSETYVLVIDRQKPDFNNATARVGAWWDAENSKVVNGTEGKEESKSINTSIGIKLGDVFTNIEETMNAGTVSAADFDIDGLTPLGGSSQDNQTPLSVFVPTSDSNWIFLTVPAMAPNAAPTINLTTTAGGISDQAVNAQDSGTVISTDQQAPTLTVTIDTNLDDEKATLTISTNETITGLPTVKHGLGTTESTTGVTVSTTAVNTWSAVVKPGVDGAYSLKVAVADANTNAATKGSATPLADFPLAGDIALYIDSNLAAPTVTPANGTSVEITDPFFITVNFAAEASDLGTNDAHKTVTITAITLDGVDISADLDPQGVSTSFDIAKLSVTTGAHTLVVEAQDAAGNKLASGDQTTKFTITSRKAYKVSMNAGWNLISFPGAPIDGALDSVLPATHPATDVLRFDDGVWQIASRSAGGTWEGTLTSIDEQHGYWVNSSSSQSIESLLSLQSVGSAAQLPTINVEAGWNLVSVIDLAQAAQNTLPTVASEVDDDDRGAKAYLTSIDWSVAYTYSAKTRVWTRYTDSTACEGAAGTPACLQNGAGVWVWANKSGTLIP